MYHATLYNDQGCAFDNSAFTNKADMIRWARGRGSKYKLQYYVEYDYETISVCNAVLFKNGRMVKAY